MRFRPLSLAILAVLAGLMVMAMIMPAVAAPQPIFKSDGDRRITQFDPAGDGDFSATCVEDGSADPITGIGTGVPAGRCDNDIPQVDLLSYTFAYLPPTHGSALTVAQPLGSYKVGTIEAKWNFAGAWPAGNEVLPLVAGDQSPETITTLSARVNFRNPFLQVNDVVAACNATDGTTRRTEAGDDHWLDQHSLFIWFSYDFEEGTGWDGNIGAGYYAAYADDNFHNAVLDFETNPWYCGAANCSTAGKDPGNGVRYYHALSGDRKSLTVRMPAVYVDQNSFCTGDVEYFPFALSAGARATEPVDWPNASGQGFGTVGATGNNDRLTDVQASLGPGVLVGSPVPIPVGDVTGNTICPPLDTGADLRAQLRQQVEGVTGPLPAWYPWVTCGPALRPGASIQWILGFTTFADLSSLANGTPAGHQGLADSKKGLVGNLDLIAPLASTLNFSGVGCYQGVTGTGAGTDAGPVWPFLTPGQACAIHNPVGSRQHRNIPATIIVAD